MRSESEAETMQLEERAIVRFPFFVVVFLPGARSHNAPRHEERTALVAFQLRADEAAQASIQARWLGYVTCA